MWAPTLSRWFPRCRVCGWTAHGTAQACSAARSSIRCFHYLHTCRLPAPLWCSAAYWLPWASVSPPWDWNAHDGEVDGARSGMPPLPAVAALSRQAFCVWCQLPGLPTKSLPTSWTQVCPRAISSSPGEQCTWPLFPQDSSSWGDASSACPARGRGTVPRTWSCSLPLTNCCSSSSSSNSCSSSKNSSTSTAPSPHWTIRLATVCRTMCNKAAQGDEPERKPPWLTLHTRLYAGWRWRKIKKRRATTSISSSPSPLSRPSTFFCFASTSSGGIPSAASWNKQCECVRSQDKVLQHCRQPLTKCRHPSSVNHRKSSLGNGLSK